MGNTYDSEATDEKDITSKGQDDVLTWNETFCMDGTFLFSFKKSEVDVDFDHFLIPLSL